MPRDGSGNYSLPSGNPVVTGTTISSTTHNNTMQDIASALSASLTKDGQAVPTANQPMGGYKHTNVGDAAARTDYAKAGQVQDGTFTYLTSPSGTNDITATAALTMSALAAGQQFVLIPANTNTGATTLNVNSIGAKNVYMHGAACGGGELVQNVPVVLVYDGTQFNIIGPSPGRGWEVIQKQTVSTSVSAIDFTTGITSAYSLYWFVGSGLAVSDDDSMALARVFIAGPTIQNSNGQYTWSGLFVGPGGTVTGNGSTVGSLTSAMGLSVAATATAKIGNNTGEGLNFSLYLPRPSGTTQRKRCTWDAYYTAASGGVVTARGAGEYGSTAAIVGLRFTLDQGTFEAGTITALGLRL